MPGGEGVGRGGKGWPVSPGARGEAGSPSPSAGRGRARRDLTARPPPPPGRGAPRRTSLLSARHANRGPAARPHWLLPGDLRRARSSLYGCSAAARAPAAPPPLPAPSPSRPCPVPSRPGRGRETTARELPCLGGRARRLLWFSHPLPPPTLLLPLFFFF